MESRNNTHQFKTRQIYNIILVFFVLLPKPFSWKFEDYQISFKAFLFQPLWSSIISSYYMLAICILKNKISIVTVHRKSNAIAIALLLLFLLLKPILQKQPLHPLTCDEFKCYLEYMLMAESSLKLSVWKPCAHLGVRLMLAPTLTLGK